MLATPISANRTPAGEPGRLGGGAGARARARRSGRRRSRGEPRARRADRPRAVGDDVDAGVGIVDPVHRHLVDAQARALGQHEQFRVEEPAASSTSGSSSRARSARIALNPHCASGSARERARGAAGCSSREMNSRFGPRTHARPAREPAADRQVAVAGHQRRDQRQQRGQVGGEVDVHVREDPASLCDQTCVSARPRPFWSRWTASTPSSSAASRRAIAQVASVLRVVRDRDPRREGERAEIRVQAADRGLELRLLVEHRDHDVEHRHRLGQADLGSLGKGKCGCHAPDSCRTT